MSDLRDPKTIVDLLVDYWRLKDEATTHMVLDTLVYERDNTKGFKPAPKTTFTRLLDTMMATRTPTVASPIAIPGRQDPAFIPPAEVKLDSKVGGFDMTKGQANAWSKLEAWLKTDESFFVLRGFAGTGKSFLQQKLAQYPGHNFYFSAPTNKATKVLSDFIGEMCKTTYSLLGLRMVADEDRKVLSNTGRIPDLGYKPVLVIDEAGMIPKFMAEMLSNLAESHGWRIIFVGDPAQLNPIGERRSVVWSMAKKEWSALLTEVKRFDNQLLALSVLIRTALKDKDYESSPIKNDNDGREGVFVVTKREMLNEIRKLKLDDWRKTKVACWRNKTVNAYTKVIRDALGFNNDYDPDDLIMLAAPIVDSGGQILAYTDEEFQIKSIEPRTFTFPEGNIDARAIALNDSSLVLYVPDDEGLLESFLNSRSGKASRCKNATDRRVLWEKFWTMKNQFHSIRHGYAMTVHRLQGSSLDHIFVDQADILCNQDVREAYRCLYVAATRARFSLTTY
jgi:AAA domain/UvrD-like helicase C-terminal domain